MNVKNIFQETYIEPDFFGMSNILNNDLGNREIFSSFSNISDIHFLFIFTKIIGDTFLINCGLISQKF